MNDETARVFIELNDALPSNRAEFNISKIGSFYSVYIYITFGESLGVKPFKVLTESTTLLGALKQALNLLRYYWIEKEDETVIINQIIEELKQEGLIEKDVQNA